ncbi:MAG: glycosyltransferase family 2 protein [Halioglobus sp.]
MDIAVLLPAHNEAATIGATIDEFRTALPQAKIWVCDNCSDDDTSAIASSHGASVLFQPFKGKGNAVKRLFSTVDADVYVLADADKTYDSLAAQHLIQKLVSEDLDMVIGARKGSEHGQYRRGHKAGNLFFSNVFSFLFRLNISDLFSGYRVMSRRFVKTFPCVSKGFELETELNAHSATHRLNIAEVPTNYYPRPEGSQSKLNKYSDGLRILLYLLYFLRDHKPLKIFSTLSAVLFIIATLFFIPIYVDFLALGTVEKFPTLFISVVIYLSGFLSFFTGLILDAIRVNKLTNFSLQYNRTARAHEA